MRYGRQVLLCALAAALVLPAHADDLPSLEELNDKLETFKEEAKDKAREKVLTLANGYLQKRLSSLSIRRIDNSGNDKKDGYALDYDWSKDWTKSDAKNQQWTEDSPIWNLVATDHSVELFANGSYTEEDVDNREDLSKFGFSLSYRKAHAPWVDNSHNTRAYVNCLRAADPYLEQGRKSEATLAVKVCRSQYIDPVADKEGSIWALDTSLKYQVEGNYDFTEKQEVYGAHIAFASQPGRNSALRYLNVLDFPFQATRALTGDDGYQASFPTLSVALEQVDPTDNTNRNALSEGKDQFDRLHWMASFVTRISQYDHNPITFEWTYQLYDEVDAPDAIEAAGLDRFHHRKSTIYIPPQVFGLELKDDEFYLQYVSGRLPFDVTTGEAVVVGWKTNLDTLFKRFSAD